MQSVSKISNLCDHNPPTLQTDRQTDGQTGRRHAISIPRYAHSASRGKKFSMGQVSQEDGAPAHTARLTQTWITSKDGRPDLNEPLDAMSEVLCLIVT